MARATAQPIPLLLQYQSPPGSGGNDGALPKSYDPAWSTYVNLTPAQIVAFTQFPADLLIYANQRRWEAQIITGQPTGALPSDASLGQLVSTITQLFTAHRQLLPEIIGPTPTVTTRAQIDATYAAIVPNSPSGMNPSPT